MNLDITLNHLSSEELKDLITRYYADEKIKSLLEEFKINCKPSELYTLFPEEVFEDIMCNYCDVPMIRKRVSKTSFVKGTIECPNCKHKLNDVNCKCISCNESKRWIVEDRYIYRERKELNELTIKDRIYLAALLRGIETEELDNRVIFMPLNSSNKNIAPTYAREIEMLIHLASKGILSAHASSELSAFSGDLIEGNYAEKYYVSKVKYTLNLEYISELTNPKIEVSDENLAELYDIAREISFDECYEYLNYQMDKVKFEFNPGKTTEEVFNELLDTFSIGQIYCVIYTAITQATRYYQESKVSKKQAVNSVITRCRGYAERAIANEWCLKNYSRPYDCKQSEISMLFFNRIVGLGDQYREEVYSYDNFKSLMNLPPELI